MKKALPIIITVLIIGGGLAVVSGVFARNSNQQIKNTIASIPQGAPQTGSKLQTNVNQNFAISVPGNKNLKKLNYTIDTANTSNEIIINGQRVQSVGGKSFLILNLKISNENTQGVQINSRDYIRLAAPNSNSEWWAPEIYNDPVEVQAISTKLTRVGFTVDGSQKTFKLRVGEVGADKRDIDLSF